MARTSDFGRGHKTAKRVDFRPDSGGDGSVLLSLRFGLAPHAKMAERWEPYYTIDGNGNVGVEIERVS